MISLSRFDNWTGLYLVALLIGVACLLYVLFHVFIARSHMERLRGLSLDLDSAPSDVEEVLLPKETVYFDAGCATSFGTPLPVPRLYRFLAVAGGGLTLFALLALFLPLALSSPLQRLVIAGAAGLVTGAALYQGISALWVGRPPPGPGHEELQDLIGEVTVTIPLDSFGQIAVNAGGKRLLCSARSEDLSPLPRGAAVRVVDVVGSVAVVQQTRPTDEHPP